MGIRINRHLRLWALIFLVMAATPGTGADFPREGPLTFRDRPLYAPNQVLVTVAPGQSETALNGLIAKGLTVARKPLFSTTYVLELPASIGSVDQFLGNKSSLLASNPGVQYLDRNCYYYPSATPNDEFYPTVVNAFSPLLLDGQYALRPGMNMFAPEGWDLQKGSESVVVAVIDTGVRDRYKVEDDKITRVPHPDLENRLLFGIDIADYGFYGDLDDDDKNPGPAPSEEDRLSGVAPHGTHVAGIIAAQADNWIGTAGLCWDYVWILPIKVFKDQYPAGLVADTADMIDGIYYAMLWRGIDSSGEPMRVNVINMSLGRPGYAIQAEESIIKQAVRSGIIVVAAAGNSWDYGPYAPGYPASYPDVICAGASDYDNVITDFSQRGAAMDITAPGYDVLSTVWYKFLANPPAEPSPEPTPPGTVWPQPDPMPEWPDPYGNTFAYFSGTSMSSPYVAAAAALLISHGVPPADVKPILYSTATPRGIGYPNETYGWGIVNVYEALKKASIEVEIGSPTRGAVLRTGRPRFRINLRHADLDTFRLWIDGTDTTGDGIPDSQPTMGGPTPEISNWRDYVHVLDEAAGKKYLLFEYAVDPSKVVGGVHHIYATAESDMTLEVPPPPPVVDSYFRINPQTLGTGWRLFSVPFHLSESKKPEEILGTSGMLARWNYTSSPSGEYALYSLDGSRTDDEATFTPTSAYAASTVQPLDFSYGTPPAGLGYWLYLPSGANVTVPDGYGDSMDKWPYTISLYYGWNIVGNPFTFPVDWSNVMVEYAGERLTAAEAAAQGWISNAIFRYDTVYRRYTWRDVGSAVMIPWEGEWVRVKVRTPDVTPDTIDAWSDEFSDGVIDQVDPEPQWYAGNTNGSVLETGGMLKLAGTAGQASYMYVTDKALPIYTDFIVDARLSLDNPSPTMVGGPAVAELRFRAGVTGIGYSLAFRANDTPTTISLRRSDSGQVIKSKQATAGLTSGSAFYVTITAVGSHLKIRIGTFPGRGDVADWELDDSSFTGAGSFWLINDGMLDLRWDYFRYNPVPVRPADVKIIVAPNPYTGAVQ